MKYFVKVSLAFSLVFLLSFPTAAGSIAQTKDFKALIGIWDIEITDIGYIMEFVFTLKDGELTGELFFDKGAGIMENITFDKNELTFSVSVDAGIRIVGADVTATINGIEIFGNMESDMGASALIGTKRE